MDQYIYMTESIQSYDNYHLHYNTSMADMYRRGEKMMEVMVRQFTDEPDWGEILAGVEGMDGNMSAEWHNAWSTVKGEFVNNNWYDFVLMAIKWRMDKNSFYTFLTDSKISPWYSIFLGKISLKLWFVK